MAFLLLIKELKAIRRRPLKHKKRISIENVYPYTYVQIKTYCSLWQVIFNPEITTLKLQNDLNICLVHFTSTVHINR